MDWYESRSEATDLWGECRCGRCRWRWCSSAAARRRISWDRCRPAPGWEWRRPSRSRSRSGSRRTWGRRSRRRPGWRGRYWRTAPCRCLESRYGGSCTSRRWRSTGKWSCSAPAPRWRLRYRNDNDNDNDKRRRSLVWGLQLLHRPSGTLFRHICARHWLVADSLEMV